MNYEAVIGLEIHAELKTNSKCFCSCANEFGGEPNTHCCPVCIGLPGALPVLNRNAFEKTIRAGLSVGCTINDEAIFERKNYFYPDLAKAYQISQLEKPICLGGGLETKDGFVRLNRIHLEEDAGKLIHEGAVSLIDYNRGGVPLIEIVTEPDIHSAEQAVEFLTKLRTKLIFAGVAECRMEEGGMRCDVNLSVREEGSDKLGIRTEMKNLNSFKSVAAAIEYEFKRQVLLIKRGEIILQETRRWDDNAAESFCMRVKEDSDDYRYFPDPDLLCVDIPRELVNKIKEEMPLSAEQRKQKYTEELGLPEYDAGILTSDVNLSNYFEETIKVCKDVKAVSNFIMTEILRNLKVGDKPKVDSQDLGYLLNLILEKKISRTNGKDVFFEIWENGGNAKEIVEKRGLLSAIDEKEIDSIIEKIIKDNPKGVEDYKQDQDKVLRFFIGQLMRETKGKADASQAIEKFKKALK